jgi:hypothetical protein
MSNKKATQDALETLHAQLAKKLQEKIESGECTAADLAVARQFLKDNGIESLPTSGNPLGKLAAQLPFPSAEHAEQAEEDRPE